MKNRLNGKRAVVTGATSGIGKAIAILLAEFGVNLILTGRRLSRLKELAQQLQETYSIQVTFNVFDVSNRKQVEAFVNQIDLEKIDILINNAGLALGIDPVDKALLDDWEIMIDTNVKGIMYLTRYFSEVFKRKNRGHILNIGSTAGWESYPGGAAYAASKHAVRAFTRSAKMDLLGTKVRVSLLSPGLVETEFSKVRFKGDNQKADNVYRGIEPLIAEDIADIAVFTLNAPDHVNILDTIVVPVAQSSSTMVYRDENS